MTPPSYSSAATSCDNVQQLPAVAWEGVEVLASISFAVIQVSLTLIGAMLAGHEPFAMRGRRVKEPQ